MVSISAHEVAEHAGAMQAVTVKALSDSYDDDPDQTKTGFTGTDLVRFEDGTAAELASLIARLFNAEQMRCHLPRYSLLFTGPGAPELEVALCFRCNNARVRVGGELGWFTFDGESDHAQELLRRIQLADPDKH